jgi:GntR family transcriptional regulator
MKTERNTGIAQYVQLASVLRHQIANGALRAGGRLPTVVEMADRHKVARITVRQAYGLLVREGFVTSARGRGTFVVDAPPSPDVELNKGLRDAINNPATEDLHIDLMEQRRKVSLPVALQGTHSAYVRYDFVRKRHIHAGEVFCLVDIYVASEIRALFPRGAEKKHKIAWLLSQHAPTQVAQVHQTLSVAPADIVLSNALECPFATPIAHMKRHVLDQQGRIVMAGLFWYRGDRFTMDMKIPFDVWLQEPGLVTMGIRNLPIAVRE